MSTLFISAIIIAGTIAIFLLFILANKKSSQRRNKSLLRAFNHAGAERGLSFSSQEFLKTKIIGLDGLNQTLLILDFTDAFIVTDLPLADIKDCIVKKEYENIDYDSAKRSQVEQELRWVNLQFSFKKRAGNISLSFYDSKINSIYEMEELHAKAWNWQLLLSKMLLRDMEART